MASGPVRSRGSSWESNSVGAESGLGRSWVVSGTERQYLVGGLTSDTAFGFSVVAATRVGEGQPGSRVTQRPVHEAPAAIASFSDKTVSA